MDTKLMCLQNNRSEFLFDKVDERILNYLNNNCLNFDLKNHFLLIILIDIARKKDARSIQRTIGTLSPRFKNISTNFNITRFSDFDVNVHLYAYLKSEIFPDDSNSKRSELMSCYIGAEYSTKKWIHNNLSFEEQEHYKQFLLQPFLFDSRDFSFRKLAKEQAQTIRKDETDAIVQMLPTILAEANLRWNQIKRLQDALQQQIQEVEAKSLSLPFEFYYDEPERIGEKFHFRLWDKPSFVLHHQTDFSEIVIKQATQKKVTYSDENNAYFLEFIRAETIEDETEGEGLWFNELIEFNVLGDWYKNVDRLKNMSVF